MNLSQALQHGQEVLRDLDNPIIEAQVLLMAATARALAYIRTHDQEQLSLSERRQYQFFLEQRRSRQPTAYILGYKNWANYHILLSPSVLIPRDETETLAHLITTHWPVSRPEFIFWDIGTGSGCLSVFLGKKLNQLVPNQIKSWSGIASDISLESLVCAQKNFNAFALSADIQTIQSDLLVNTNFGKHDHLDLIVANLPYLPNGIKISPEVNQEPSSALYGGTDGLDIYRQLCEQLSIADITFSQLWLEFLPSQQKAIQELLRKNWPQALQNYYPAVDNEVRFVCLCPKTCQNIMY